MPDLGANESMRHLRESMTSDILKHQILDEFHEYDPVEPEFNNRNTLAKNAEDLNEAHRFTFKKSGNSSLHGEKRQHSNDLSR